MLSSKVASYVTHALKKTLMHMLYKCSLAKVSGERLELNGTRTDLHIHQIIPDAKIMYN
jgi:hypothetical protein